ncbi:glycosyltransferase family 2 protein [Paenibacillus pini]|uniref:Glycosyltransferase n=1 Tax=Paenibacillus pini JCM 16418 TaxID=1236976 RepID=W7YZH2_9BACL|nr:glycosyltransferase family 2 protein [Paenibacillus pini]GAF07774.1 glycosyltransferase [Paenibacillus pini JCM 16418]
MNIFVLGADRNGALNQTTRSIHGIFPLWNVVPIQSGQMEKLNLGIAASDSAFCMTIRAGSILLPAFRLHWEQMEQKLQEGLGWIQFLPAEEDKEYLDTFRSGEIGPVLWNISLMRSAPFPGSEWLPFDTYVEVFAINQMGLYCNGLNMWLDNVWKPEKSKQIGWKRKEAEWKLVSPLLNYHKQTDQCTTPLVSVLMAVYNDEKYLKWAVHSITCQTFKDWELIIIDDGSDVIAKNLMAELVCGERIRVVRQDNNLGKAHALNIGLSHVRGKWVLELDADDWLTPECIEILHNATKSASNEVAFVYGNYYEWMEQRDGSLSLSSPRIFNPSMSERELLQRATPLAPRFYRTESLRDISGWYVSDPSNGRLYEDMLLILRLMNHFETKHVNKLLYHRRVRSSSITRNYNHQYEQWSEWAQHFNKLK